MIHFAANVELLLYKFNLIINRFATFFYNLTFFCVIFTVKNIPKVQHGPQFFPDRYGFHFESEQRRAVIFGS